MTQIILRPARYSELPRIAHVSAQAFWDDNLYGDLIHPHRKAYPADMDLWWLRRARVNFWDYTWQWIVAVEVHEAQAPNKGQEKTQKQQEVLVGFAQWVRKGQGGKNMQCAWYDPRKCTITSYTYYLLPMLFSPVMFQELGTQPVFYLVHRTY